MSTSLLTGCLEQVNGLRGIPLPPACHSDTSEPVLEEERRWQTMTRAELLTYVEQLEAQYRMQGENPLGHP